METWAYRQVGDLVTLGERCNGKANCVHAGYHDSRHCKGMSCKRGTKNISRESGNMIWLGNVLLRQKLLRFVKEIG